MENSTHGAHMAHLIRWWAFPAEATPVGDLEVMDHGSKLWLQSALEDSDAVSHRGLLRHEFFSTLEKFEKVSKKPKLLKNDGKQLFSIL